MGKKVFILGDGGYDYSDAERFGTLVHLTVPTNAKWDIAAVFDALKEGLEDAEPDDYLIVSHMPSVVAVATAIMVEWFGCVNFLIYRFDKYEEKNLILDNV